MNRISNMSAHTELVVESDTMRGLSSSVPLFRKKFNKVKDLRI